MRGKKINRARGPEAKFNRQENVEGLASLSVLLPSHPRRGVCDTQRHHYIESILSWVRGPGVVTLSQRPSYPASLSR